MPNGMTVDAPPGYIAMCQRDASLCDGRDPAVTSGIDAGSGTAPRPTAIDWTSTAQPAGMRALNQVNRFVNANVRQRRDANVGDAPEYWRPSGVGFGAWGDCKDIAVEKRQELIEQGYPAKDLFLAIGYRPDIGLHAVLVAHTADGDLILDSRTPYIVAWSEAPYVWVKHQSRQDPFTWVLFNAPNNDAPAMRLAALDLGAVQGYPPAQTR